MKILVTGATGLIGRNFCHYVKEKRASYDVQGIGSADADLSIPGMLDKRLASFQPDVVVHLAALVGGIQANNSQKYKFLLKNTQINLNTIDSCISHSVPYILAAGTGCAYPKNLEGEILREEYYLDGVPEPTNDAYAYSKRLLLNQLEAAKQSMGTEYCYFLPANIYGPHDNFHLTHSHVVPGLIHRMYKARQNGDQSFQIWGDGTACRDFLFIEDLVDAMILLIENKQMGVVNVATGYQHSILDLANLIKKKLGYSGNFTFDESKPTGQKTRINDITKIASLNWSPRYTLQKGIDETINWFEENFENVRAI